MEKNSENKVKYGSVKELAFSMAAYASGSIFGPLVFFGIIGFAMDHYFQTKPLFIVISVLVSFIATNVFLMKKIKKLMNEMDKQAVIKNEKNVSTGNTPNKFEL